MLFALVAGSTEPANCGLATMVMWICGSYYEWNKHHEEEAWPDFCCSLLLVRSLHPSGYIQEGQGVNYDYLLLGVCYRNSPSSTGMIILLSGMNFMLSSMIIMLCGIIILLSGIIIIWSSVIILLSSIIKILHGMIIL